MNNLKVKYLLKIISALTIFSLSGCGGGGGSVPVDIDTDTPKTVLTFDYSKPSCTDISADCQEEHLEQLKGKTINFYEMNGYGGTPTLITFSFDDSIKNTIQTLGDKRLSGKSSFLDYDVSCYYFGYAKDYYNLSSTETYLCETFGYGDRYYLFDIDKTTDTIVGKSISKSIYASVINVLELLDKGACCVYSIFSSGKIDSKYDLWDYFVSNKNSTKNWDTYEYDKNNSLIETKFNGIVSTETIESSILVKTTNSIYGGADGEYINFERFNDYIKLSFNGENTYYKRYIAVGDTIDADRKYQVVEHKYTNTPKDGYTYSDVIRIESTDSIEYIQKDKGSVGRIVTTKSSVSPYEILGYDVELVNNFE